jgi:adenosylmethionine-8-amino-7-oxononanoate aminotransferase
VSHVFHRSTAGTELRVAVRAAGSTIWDADGTPYLDAAAGAIVVGIGHGDRAVVDAVRDQASRIAYAHGTQFTTEALERYAQELAPLVPVDDPRIYPVSGGSEAVETALKLARAYHLARGEPSRTKVIARWGSYHGNTLGALDASGREPLRRPYEPWLGRFLHVPPAYEYRCPLGSHPHGCGESHARWLDETIRREGPETVAAFIAEPVVGATLGAAVPTDDYWPAVERVCREHGVLLIADEVMTGFGRTGRWFACEHWGVRPDVLVAGKGASSGYWPLGLTICSGPVYQAVVTSSFVHGFTYSHHVVGAAAGLAVVRRLRDGDLVGRSEEVGAVLLAELRQALADDPHVGDVRGLGLMIGIEMVRDREEKAPFLRQDGVAERIVAAARDRGVLLYPSTGCANGTDGDVVMLGPPFVITEEERHRAVDVTAAAIGAIERSPV